MLKFTDRFARRRFLKAATAAATLATLDSQIAKAAGTPDPTILVISGWQAANIGDIAHTPGVLAILQKHLPAAKLILWPKSESEETVRMLRKHFPKLTILGTEDAPTLEAAFAASDFALHSSGPMVVGHEMLRQWHSETGKPFGVLGVTISYLNDPLKELLEKAAFVYTRETKSLENLREAGIDTPTIGFAPDSTFAMSIRDEAKARQTLQNFGLEDRPFVCAVPRLRKTPYHQIHDWARENWSAERIGKLEALNARHAEPDHAKLRDAMIRWVRETGHAVLCCPEMTYQVDIIKPLLIDPLPEDVRPHVFSLGRYWLPDEAASVYSRARCVMSFECHSPIIALGAGTPAFYLRQPEDTIKGQMYYDLGMGDWVFEIEQTDGRQIGARLMDVHQQFDAAQETRSMALAKAARLHAAAMNSLRSV